MITHRPQAGFGIVEVMVALVVLAVGMLGIASLYVTTLKSSGSAISRMQAVNLASDLADRIRANRFARGAYTGPGAQHDCTGADDCSESEMAENDVFLWKRQIDALLPGLPDGDVVYQEGVGNAPDTYTITVSWNEPVAAADEDAEEDAEDDEGALSYTLTMQIDP